MTFSKFAKLLHQFDGNERTNGMFVLDLIEDSLELTSDESELETYNPIESEENARKYYDGTRKISHENYTIITRHYYRNNFMKFLGKIIDNDDKVRLLSFALQKEYPNVTENNAEEICAEIFERIIVTCDEEYVNKKTVKKEPPEQKEFKDKVYAAFLKIVEKENWPFKSQKYLIFNDKEYYLPIEDKEEIFDIAIENYNDENPLPAMQILIKCKKSSSQIRKDEIVLFFDSARNVSGCNKIIFVSNASFEKDALYYAIKNGIALIRIFDDERTKWLAPRHLEEKTTYIDKERSKNEIEKALSEEDYCILNNFAVGIFRENCCSELAALFKEITDGTFFPRTSNLELFGNDIVVTNPPYLDFISADEFKNIAQNVLNDIYGVSWNTVKKISAEDLISYIDKRFDFHVIFSNLPASTFEKKLWALVDYKNKTIFIDGKYDTNPNLIKFSIAHELSHLLLHKEFLQSGHESFWYFYTDSKFSKQMETQANKLANYIILPEIQFKSEFQKIIYEYRLNYRGYYLYLDNQSCNQQQFISITNRLKNVFDVSREHIKIKMQELGWLKIAEDNFLWH